MKPNLEILQALPIFRSISAEGIKTMMDCFCGKFVSLKQNDTLFGENNKTVCLLDGAVESLKKGTFSPMPTKENPLCATADSLVLVMESHTLLYPCYGCCFFHAQLLQNMREDGLDFKALENQ
ncbi:MAG: hypothetical protein EOM28_08245 [Clostridia bacterium]|nr:hypothetical protein [Clostridia bacterium]